MSAQQHFCEQLRLQEDIEDALAHAAEGKATPEEIKLLEWATGVQLRRIHTNAHADTASVG